MVALYGTFDEAALHSLKNQFLCTLPLSLLVPTQSYSHYHWLYLPILVVMSDIYFFCTHITMHKYLWSWHKHHHRGKVQVAKSLDASLPEHLICNLGSFVFPFVFFTPSTPILCTWVAVSTVSTCISHIGYTTLGDKGRHLHHHRHLHCNYGTGLYVMDRLCGTLVDTKEYDL